jgi:hypothetical protein
MAGCDGRAKTFVPRKPLSPRLAQQRVVFTDECAGLGVTVIHSIRLDGRGLHRVAIDSSDPAVSADGAMIAYWGEPRGSVHDGIYIKRADESRTSVDRS